MANDFESLRSELRACADANGHVANKTFLQELFTRLHALCEPVVDDETKKKTSKDHFQRYASVYPQVIGRPCLESFMRGYLNHFLEDVAQLEAARILSVGCGTGLVELEHLVPHARVASCVGMDYSPAMVEQARVAGLDARMGDATDRSTYPTVDQGQEPFNVVYAGLNVPQYLPADELETAIANFAAAAEWFVGDFITPDHVRWYPNVIESSDGETVSVRHPRLVVAEQDPWRPLQASEIFNIYRRDGRLFVSYEGIHHRSLVSVGRVRALFKEYYHTSVVLLDAHSLRVLPPHAETCPSTRYVIIARR